MEKLRVRSPRGRGKTTRDRAPAVRLESDLAFVSRLDLATLSALAAIHEEGSVSRAAAKLGVTQPRLSKHLAWLRASLGDPLFVFDGKRMRATPYAESLAPRVREGLVALAAALRNPATFEPETARRHFTLQATEYGQFLMLPGLCAPFERAPGLSLTARGSFERSAEMLESGEVSVSVGVTPPAEVELRCRKLFTDGFVCVLREGHPALAGGLSLERFVEHPHVVVSPQGRGKTNVDPVLGARGLSRRVAVRLSSFLTVPFLVRSTDLIATVPRRVAERFASLSGLVQVETPVPVPPVKLMAYWHPRWDVDPGHRWFRERLFEVGEALEHSTPGGKPASGAR